MWLLEHKKLNIEVRDFIQLLLDYTFSECAYILVQSVKKKKRKLRDPYYNFRSEWNFGSIPITQP